MEVMGNVTVPSVDFECAMTVYAISRSIIAVVLNNSFIPLATRRTEKTTATRKQRRKHGSSDGGDDSSKQKPSSNYYTSLRASF